MKTILLALAAAATIAAPAAAIVTLHVQSSYASGATFDGLVSFDDSSYMHAIDVVGVLTGYGPASANINWVWSDGLNLGEPGSYGTILMSGVKDTSWDSFVVLDIDISGPGTPTFLDGTQFFQVNSIDYGDVLVSGTITAIPEPASWALMITGFGLVGAAQRLAARRRTVAATA